MSLFLRSVQCTFEQMIGAIREESSILRAMGVMLGMFLILAIIPAIVLVSTPVFEYPYVLLYVTYALFSVFFSAKVADNYLNLAKSSK